MKAAVLGLAIAMRDVPRTQANARPCANPRAQQSIRARLRPFLGVHQCVHPHRTHVRAGVSNPPTHPKKLFDLSSTFSEFRLAAPRHFTRPLPYPPGSRGARTAGAGEAPAVGRV